MKFTAATVLALATAVLARPNQVAERDVDPASVTAALITALPSSLLAVAITNPAEASTEIAAEFATGTPTWFSKLPTDVQTYLLTVGGAAVTPSPIGSGGLFSSNTTATTGKFLNTTSSTAAGSTTDGSAATSAASSSKGPASSSSSTGGASMPTQVVGAGIAGILGIVGMLAL